MNEIPKAFNIVSYKETKMKKICVFITFLFLNAIAFGQPLSIEHVYADVFSGLNFVNKHKQDEFELNFNPGYVLGTCIGYNLSNIFKLETEIAYRRNSFYNDKMNNFSFPVSGSIKKTTLMTNGILEIPLKNHSLIPYCGVGIGGKWDERNSKLDPINVKGVRYTFERVVEKSSGGAYQFIAGMNFCSEEKMGVSLEYRFLNGPTTEINNTFNLNLKRCF